MFCPLTCYQCGSCYMNILCVAVVCIPADLLNKTMLITRYLFTLNLCSFIFESIFDCISIRLPVFDLRHTLLAQYNTCPPAGIMFYRWCIKEYFEQQRLTLVSLQSRINLSPFTKDFRAGEHSMSLQTYFFNPFWKGKQLTIK